MNFDDALGYVQGRLRLGWKLGNERFLALLELLGNPHDRLRVVHIAGTKGKGSTAAMAASILHSAGYRTGLYLSPYVYDICERVQIDSVPISRTDFARWVAAIKPHVEALEDTPLGPTTEFELKTAIGFCFFAEQQVDYAVIEVGLGGRLDATNVVSRPLATAITTIGFDHVEILGPTLSDIAREKAGIVKPGVPCVTGVAAGTEAHTMISSICAERGSPRIDVGEEGSAGSGVLYRSHGDGTMDLVTPLRRLSEIRLGMHGGFQHANAAVAVGTLDSIPAAGLPPLGDGDVRRGLDLAVLPGRMERIADRPAVIADGAHNEMAARALAAALREDELVRRTGTDGMRRLILVVGMSRNHAPASFLEPLLALRPAAVIATQPRFHPRDAHEVAAVAASAKVDHVRVAIDVETACRDAIVLARPEDVVCLTGSFYTLGEMPPLAWRRLLSERK
ncbi:MAG: bifunctional folylpolyglutamate synthase/dihydrofolate synthase [Capsulimonadaceae bacterium]